MKLLLTLIILASNFPAWAGNNCAKVLGSRSERELMLESGYRVFSMADKSPNEKWNFLSQFQGENILIEVTSDRTGDGDTIDLGLLQNLVKKGRGRSNLDQVQLRLNPRDQRGSISMSLGSVKQIRVRGQGDRRDEKYFPLIDLEQELKLSRLPTKIIDLLKRYSAGVGTMYDLLAREKDLKFNSAILGLDIPEYGLIGKALGLETFIPIYKHIEFAENDVRPHTEVFMDSIDGRSTVFLIPRNFLKYFDDIDYSSREGTGVTIEEFKWLLKDRKRLKNVYFIFGAYNAIPAHLPVDTASTDKEIRKYFLNFKKYLYAR